MVACISSGSMQQMLIKIDQKPLSHTALGGFFQCLSRRFLKLLRLSALTTWLGSEFQTSTTGFVKNCWYCFFWQRFFVNLYPFDRVIDVSLLNNKRLVLYLSVAYLYTSMVDPLNLRKARVGKLSFRSLSS